MPILSLKSFEELLQDLVLIVRASTDKITDFNVGSISRSYLEAIALLGQYLDFQVETLEESFYLSTALGTNLDKRVADFDLFRVLGNKASGFVYFYSYTQPTADILIPAGTLMSTVKDDSGIGRIFAVAQDTYLLTTSALPLSGFPYAVLVPVTATLSGILGNVDAKLITDLITDIPGISGISNPGAITGGTEDEDDESLRQRAKLYIQSLSKGTKNALKAAILAVQGVNNVEILDYNDIVDPLGPEAIAPGVMKIIIDTDDNSIAAPLDQIYIGPTLITKNIQINIWNAIKDSVKAAGIAVLFTQTNLVPIDIDIVVVVDPDPDLNKTTELLIGTFGILFKERVSSYFKDLLVNENVLWSQIVKASMDIAGIVGTSTIRLKNTDPTLNPGTPYETYFTDIILANNAKGILGNIYVNGTLV